MKLLQIARLPLTAALLLAPLVARAETADTGKSYILAKKGKLPAPGIVRTERIVSDLTNAVMAASRNGNTVTGSFTHKVHASVSIEGLAPGKARQTLTSKTTDERVTFRGKETLTPDAGDSLQGVPVILEYKEDKTWTAVLEKGEPDAGQKTSLEEILRDLSTNSDVAVYGEAPRKPGERWKVDLKTVDNYAGVQSPTGSLAVEFVEVKEIDGIPSAILKISFDLKGDSRPGGKGPTFKRAEKGEAVIQRSLADMVNISAKFTGNSIGEGLNAEGIGIKIEGPLIYEVQTTLEKKP